MPRSDYLEILDEAEAAEPRGDVWDLDAEADRLSVKLDDLPMDEKGWDRAVNVAYRRCALRAHPDKHPPDLRNAAEANFKRLNESHKILLRVGKAVRFEAESGDAAAHIEASRRAELDAEKEEKAALSRRLASVMSLNGVAAGFNSFTNRGNQEGFVPQPERVGRRASDLQKQMASLLARCGDEFQKLARRRRRRRALRRALAFGLGVAFLWFVRKNAPQEDDLEDARNELRQIAEGLRAAIRFMGAELATAVGRPQDADEMADDLEAAFLEGRMSVNEEGGLEVLIPDDEAPGMYYKLNMSSKEDGSMSVWTEGVDGQRVEVELGDADGWDDEPAPGVFGLPAERAGGGRGTVRFETEADDSEKNERRRKKESKGDKKETKKRLFGGWGKGNP
jgi:curved DNA-binding protein CbpA